MTRRLAAILAADIIGYSKLMGEDEAGTLAALRRLRSEAFSPAVASKRGKIIKSMGDGWLVTFDSAEDAVTCAMHVQDRLTTVPTIKLRIGVHTGDVVHQDEDVFGDGVNIAARLEEISPHGGVAISDAVWGALDGTLKPSFDDQGEKALSQTSPSYPSKHPATMRRCRSLPQRSPVIWRPIWAPCSGSMPKRRRNPRRMHTSRKALCAREAVGSGWK